MTTRLRPRQHAFGPQAGKRLWRLIFALAALALIVAASLFVSLRYFNVREVAVPDVVGQDVVAAASMLAAVDLEPRPYSQYSADVPLNSVIAQTPPAGTPVREGRSVSLAVNMQREDILVPELSGMTPQEAAGALEALGLSITDMSYVDSAAPAGRIVAQAPAAGSSLAVGTEVSVSVSRGAGANRREVPAVVGLSLADAQRLLNEAGFGRVEAVISSVSRSGNEVVLEQAPAAGQEILETLPVTLYYNLADPRVVAIPDLSGASLELARVRLRALGLDPVWISEANDPEKPRGVLEVQPAGWTVRGSPVRITVNNSGTAPPPLRSFFDSERDITGFGGTEFDVSEFDVSEPRLGADLAGSLGPSGMLTLEAPLTTGDGVSSDAVSSDGVSGDAVSSRPIPITYLIDPNFTDRVYHFYVEVSDDLGERVVYEQEVRPGDKIETTIEVHGEAALSYYLDDEWFFSWFP